MSENVQSAMFEILKRIQVDISALKFDVAGLKADVASVKADVADMRPRLERVEGQIKKMRRNNAAILVMMQGVVGLFDERVKSLEEDVREILAQGG